MTTQTLSPEALVERLKGRIGMRNGPIVRRIEAGALIKFALATGETNPLFLDEDYARTTRFGGLIAAPTYVSTFPPTGLFKPLFAQDLPFRRMLHTDDIATIHRPIHAGDLISANAEFVDAYVREGRTGPMVFQMAEMTLTEAQAGLVATVRVASCHFD